MCTKVLTLLNNCFPFLKKKIAMLFRRKIHNFFTFMIISKFRNFLTLMEAYPNGQETSSYGPSQNPQRKISQNSSTSCHSTSVKERPDSRSPEQNGDQEWVCSSILHPTPTFWKIWRKLTENILKISSFLSKYFQNPVSKFPFFWKIIIRHISTDQKKSRNYGKSRKIY